MKLKVRLFFFWLIAFSCLTGLAQTNPQQPPKPPTDDTLRIETELVQFEVTVTDKQGKVVRGLKQTDFELKEDGKPQEVSYFSIGTATRPARWLGTESRTRTKEAAPTSVSTTAPETLAGRYIVLAIDDLHLSPATLMLARKALVKFIDQQMGSGDQVALVTTSGQVGMFQQFTDDREVLKRAINRLSPQERTVTNNFDVPRITSYQAELIDMGNQDALEMAVQEILRQQSMSGAAAAGPSGGRGGRGNPSPGGGMTERDRAIETARSLARMIVMQNAHYTNATLETLQIIIRNLSSLPGRKIMTLVSDGFHLGGNSASKISDVRRVIDTATRAGVVIYAVDARGLYTSPIFDASQPGFNDDQTPGVRERVENAGMQAVRNGPFALANDTGGFMVMDTNDLNLGMQKILEDTEAYYLLAFEPNESYRDGRFRKLEVRVKDHPEYKVRSSKGYFAPDDKAEVRAVEKEQKEKAQLEVERAKDPEKAEKKETAVRAARAREALSSLFPLRGIPVQMAASYVDTGKGQGFALILGHLDVSGLKFELTNGLHNATVEVVGTVFDENGKTVDGFSQRLNMQLKQSSYEQVLKAGLIFSRRVALKPGLYQVRLAALREGYKQTGSAFDWVEVSDLNKKQLTLSSIFLTTEKETDYLMAQMKPKESQEKQEAAPIPSQVARRFKLGTAVDFSLFAYNAKADAKGVTDLVVQSQLFSGSKVIYASPLSKIEPMPEAKDANYMPYAARLTLDKFEPGNYELRLLVIDRIAKTSAKRSLSFAVEP
ncbi:MAG: VWA domain-containing protein [Acidobacteria bacterium]|nr:VWA domain-containing protein [Acidobacteriota bacterium]